MKRIFLLFVLIAAACSNESAPLTITDVVVKRPMPGMHMSAGYFNLTNNSSETIVITHVTSPQFGSVEMHESIVEDGIARMVALDELVLHPGASVDFVPGGKHLMLMQPDDELGQVKLEFYAGDAAVLSVNVTASE